ncbi:hypothetical protein ASPZODRAFT_128859 [Penicilliopsis zonata CBS 506.65]|uniref:Transcription factor domain-containing protein n=1 Tax=Penicilliopsis zonata CBS 506.65 TaxID=1073090 RepID=A0A1L9ST17_9EURO|nr:hypothetical protein ASPZODRAFT_128859 [Penicilliopsis zonata CBS 506.65]OJJ50234.1 hypothetical protein ASPZODRAFT_128859 [Penicilliopsis zonata CBS 506.65]
MLEGQMVSDFISYFSRYAVNQLRSFSWMHLCPQMMRQKRPDWRACILAGSLALYGTTVGNRGATVESYRLYDQALWHIRRRLADANTVAELVPEDVGSLLILSYYEIHAPTTPVAHFEHIKAASTLLVMVGPHRCREGYWHQMFQSVRLHMLFFSLTRWTSTFFASQEWTTIPYTNQRKLASDDLTILLLHYPRLLSRPHPPNTLDSNSDTPSSEQLGAASLIMQELCFVRQKLVSQLSLVQVHDQPEVQVPLPINYSPTNSDEATAVTMYSLACILVLVRIENSDFLLTAHCDVILGAAAAVASFGDGCGLVRMAFPLATVVRYSTDLVQKGSAEKMLQSWRTDYGLIGLPLVI